MKLSKNQTSRFIMLLSFIPVFCCQVYAGGTGTTAAEFLKLGIGARALALGETFTGIADDVSAGYWNPAGLARIKRTELLTMYDSLYEGTKHIYLGVGICTKNSGVLGAQLNYSGTASIPQTDSSGNTTGDFTASDTAMILSFAKGLNEKTSLGVNLKLINQKIWEKSGSGFGLDLGGLYTATDKLSLGFTLQNLGTGIKFIQEASPLPMTIRAGAGYLLLKQEEHKLIAGADLVSVSGTSGINLGLEYVLLDKIALRTGFNTGSKSGATFGVGINLSGVSVDCALGTHEDLGSTYKVSLLAKIGEESKVPKAIKKEKKIEKVKTETTPVEALSMDDLQKKWAEAINKKDYKKAEEIDQKIKALEEQGKLKEDINKLKKQWEEAISNKDYKKAEEIDQKMKELEK